MPDYVDWDRWVGPAPMTPFHEEKLSRDNHENITNFSLGMISCWGIHHLDIAQWGNGTDATGPRTVEGTGEFPKEGDAATRSCAGRCASSTPAPRRSRSSATARRASSTASGSSASPAGSTSRAGSIQAHDDKFLRDPQNKCGTMPIKLPVSTRPHPQFRRRDQERHAGDLRHRARPSAATRSASSR